MPYFLSSFINENTGIELLMDVTNKNKVIKSLENNEVDFALVSILPNDINIEKLDLLQNKLYLVGNNKIDIINTEDLEKLPFIFREEGSGTRQTMEAFIASKELKVLKKLKLATNEAVKQALLAGLGYSIMPIIGIKNEILQKELHIIPVNGLPIKTTWSLIWLKGKKHSPSSLAFLEHLNKEKDVISNQNFNWYEQF